MSAETSNYTPSEEAEPTIEPKQTLEQEIVKTIGNLIESSATVGELQALSSQIQLALTRKEITQDAATYLEDSLDHKRTLLQRTIMLACELLIGDAPTVGHLDTIEVNIKFMSMRGELPDNTLIELDYLIRTRRDVLSSNQ